MIYEFGFHITFDWIEDVGLDLWGSIREAKSTHQRSQKESGWIKSQRFSTQAAEVPLAERDVVYHDGGGGPKALLRGWQRAGRVVGSRKLENHWRRVIF